MARIDISARVIGDRELAQALAKLSAHDIPKAIRGGVREAASQGRTTLAKSIGQRYSLSAARIKQDVPTARIAGDGQTAVITTSRKPITALSYKAKGDRRRLSISIFRGKRTPVKSGFMQTSSTGSFAGQLPFIPAVNGRTYRGDRKRNKPRRGLDVVKGPSIHAIYTGGHWAPALQARTELRIETVLVDQILKRIKAMGRGFGRA